MWCGESGDGRLFEDGCGVVRVVRVVRVVMADCLKTDVVRLKVVMAVCLKTDVVW